MPAARGSLVGNKAPSRRSIAHSKGCDRERACCLLDNFIPGGSVDMGLMISVDYGHDLKLHLGDERAGHLAYHGPLY